MIRKVIHMPAECSPNVRLALRQIGHGVTCWQDWQDRLKEGLPCGTPTGEEILEGVLTWQDVCERERTWDADHKEIGLRARFPSGAGIKLFPDDWREASWQRAVQLSEAKRKRGPYALGIDTAEGGNNSSFCVGDHLGAVEMIGEKTRDTAVITDRTKDLQKVYNVAPEKIVFDIGGGGKEHRDRLRREMGWDCQAVPFSGKTALEYKRGMTRIEDRKEVRELKQVYGSRRVEMYHRASELMNPANLRNGEAGYGVPSPRNGKAWELLDFYLRPLLRTYDEDGVMVMPKKEDLIRDFYFGESPDEADAFVLMIWGLTHKSLRAKAGAA